MSNQPHPTHAERYLNLCTLLIGEALTELSNLRQRGAVPGAHELTLVKDKLNRAAVALDGG